MKNNIKNIIKGKDTEKTKHILNLLKLASNGELPHCLVFEAPDSQNTGLKIALEISKCLICHFGNNEPCNECLACKKVNMGVHPDIKILDVKKGYKHIRVEDIRSLREDAYLRPNESDYKVYIVKNGDLMNEQAQNVLLKIFEEPPKMVKFFIVCDSRFSLLATIRSRSQIFELEEGLDSKLSAKICEISDMIIKDIFSGSYIDLMKSTARLVKDKEIFLKVAKNLYKEICDMCISRAENENKDNVIIAKSYSIQKMLELRDIIAKTQSLIKKNINNQLLVCWFCAELMKIKKDFK